MSGWIALALLFAIALAGLWAMGVRKAFLQMSGAALLFGAAGYALQGRPELPGASAAGTERAAPVSLTRLRHAFFGNFTGSEHWQLIAESYARRGQTAEAVGVLRSAVREHPGDAALWIALGNALADHSGTLTPASEIAFERANALAPGHPAPRFFLGLALARSGEPETALELWRAILAEAPADASWRPHVEDAIAALQPPRPDQAASGS